MRVAYGGAMTETAPETTQPTEPVEVPVELPAHEETTIEVSPDVV